MKKYEYKFIVDNQWCTDPRTRKQSPTTAVR
jgi:hypothetical protein